ncbi:4506_t:CDS:1, partial [Racocetra fulgida]
MLTLFRKKFELIDHSKSSQDENNQNDDTIVQDNYENYHKNEQANYKSDQSNQSDLVVSLSNHAK